MVPETDFARLPDGKDRVRCVLEKGEQFRFQHVPILERPVQDVSVLGIETLAKSSVALNCCPWLEVRQDLQRLLQAKQW